MTSSSIIKQRLQDDVGIQSNHPKMDDFAEKIFVCYQKSAIDKIE